MKPSQAVMLLLGALLFLVAFLTRRAGPQQLSAGMLTRTRTHVAACAAPRTAQIPAVRRFSGLHTPSKSRSSSVQSQMSDYWIREKSENLAGQRGSEEFSHMEAEFWNDIIQRDSRGLPLDVGNSVTKAAESLISIFNEPAEGPRLLSMSFELDPMPWWTFSDVYMRMQILKEYGQRTGEVNAVFVDPSCGFEQENIDLGPNWIVARVGDTSVDLSRAKRLFVFGAAITHPNRLEFCREQASRTQTSDVVCINCSFGYIGEPDPRQVRALARQYFKGGMDTIDLTLFPVTKLDEEVRGSSADLSGNEVLAYPMPQWLVEAGYKGTGNMAITGCSGTGKSSFMNALRGIDTHDAGAAKVGNVETTMVATPYSFTDEACQLMADEGILCKGQEHFRLWDLPGAGTPKFPLNSYLRVMGIKYFDLVVVIAAGRFTETDLTLMQEMDRNGVPFFAVRTKIDIEIENAEWDMGLSEEETKQVVRDDLRANTGLPDNRIFLVSAREPEKHDLPRLKREMNEILQRGLENKVNRALNRKLSVRRYFNTLVNNDEFVHADA